MIKSDDFGDGRPQFCFVRPRWCLSRTYVLLHMSICPQVKKIISSPATILLGLVFIATQVLIVPFNSHTVTAVSLDLSEAVSPG